MSEYTKGEWKIEAEPDGHFSILPDKSITIWRSPNAFANAQLIAAAPALLEACKALLKADLYADGEGIVNFDYPNTSDGDEAKEQAEAAIAAAEGKV